MITYEASVTVDAAKLIPRIGKIYDNISKSINDTLTEGGHSEQIVIKQRVQALTFRIETKHPLTKKEREIMRAETEKMIRAAMSDYDYQVEPLRRNSCQSSNQPVSP